MRKIQFNALIVTLFFVISFSAKAIPTPEAVEPAFDDG